MPHPTRGYSGLLHKRGFTSLLAAQALSVFNDNAYKTILIFCVLTHASRADLAWMVPAGSGLLVMPYVLFSSYAGQIADRVSKRSIIITMKALEIALMAAATLAVFSAQIPLMLGLLFLEGIHSCFLAPAKEGILPEMLADEDLSRANGLLQLTIYSMIVAGPAAAGFLVPVFRGEPYLPVACLIGTALLSFIISLGITRVPASGYREKFHWNAPGEFLRDFRGIRSDRALFLTVLGIAYFWMLGSVYLMNVYRYGPDLLHLDEHGVTYLNACLSLGIGLGAALAGRLSGDQVELGLVPLGSIGLGIFAVELFFAHHSFRLALGAHALLGVAGGIFIVPLEAFLQQRAGEQSKGRVIASSNVLTFTAVFLGSGILWLLSGPLRLRPDQVLLTMGVLSFGATAYILTILPDFMVRLCLWLLTHTFYRIEVRGAENLPRRGGALLVCNHVSFVDPFLIGACTQRFIRFLMYRPFYQASGIHGFAKLMGAIPVSDGDSPQRIAASLEEAQARLREGELVCIFAEGSITRTGNLLRFRRGFERIMRGLDVPILPIHLDRVWGSIFSYERGRFFFKWPRRIPYPVTLHVGAALPSQATAFDVRQAVMELGAEAFAHRDATQRPLPQLFFETARRNWRRFAMADSSGRILTFGRALVGSLLFRQLIRRRCENERMIGVLLPPSVPAALLNMGISFSGGVPVNLNYTASADAIDVAIARCGLKTIFTSGRVLEKLSLPCRSQMVMMEDVARSFSKADRIRALLPARLLPRFVLQRWLFPASVKLDSLATVIFSSGSTGIPRGVMLSHRNIVSNIEGIQQAIKIDRKDCLLGILPFFHSFGFTAGLWLPAISGFGVIYHTNPLDARKIGELCRTYQVTILISTPTFAWEYVRRCAAEDFRSVRLAVVGAEKMKPELMQAFGEKFGIDLFEGYGCTELSPVVAVGVPNSSGPRHRQSGNKAGTVGHSLPGVAVRVVSVEDGATLRPDQEGMLQVKGPNVMMGYLGDPEKTREVITPEGWYVTGDIARLDTDGFITITDRVSRFSKIAGEMVPHLKVEDALHHALGCSVPTMVVTGVPDERKGERLVVLHTPLNVSVDELLSRLRETPIPKLWVPRKDNFFEIDALPALGSGKLDLRRVKELALSLSVKRPREALALEP
ncbi:MAG: acyl-[ACP]--phospholipid O-acyltransferase [Acidobacteria bacterium]|nr:MAG: acyl-[ACP]--phospholipid O-acyltransferase [Acidobacteriota bacterium]